MSEAEAGFKDSLRRWIAERNSLSAPERDFDDDAPIIELGLISSLQVVELILFLEELTGQPINVDRLKPGSFRSVNAICDYFGPRSETLP